MEDSTEPSNEAYQAWTQEKSPENLNKAVNAVQPVIDRAMKTYAPNGSQIVQHHARLMAAHAIQSYDPKRGANLATHIHRQLQTLQRVAPDIDDHMKVSEGLRRDRAVVGTAIGRLQDDLGREASDEEVSDHLHMPVKRVTKVRQMMQAGVPLSVIEESGEEDSEQPDPVAFRTSNRNDWMDAVYHDLGDTDRVIMQYRTGFRGYKPLPSHEIARRLGLSGAAVSQRAKKIQERLDEFDG